MLLTQGVTDTTRNSPPWCLCLGSNLTIARAHIHEYFDYFKGLASKDEFNALNNLRKKKMKSYFFSQLFSQYFSSSSCSEHHSFFILWFCSYFRKQLLDHVEIYISFSARKYGLATETNREQLLAPPESYAVFRKLKLLSPLVISRVWKLGLPAP